MKVLVKNVQYFEWEVPDKLVDKASKKPQEIVDEYFDPDHISVAEDGDEYYEFVEIKEV